MSHNLHWMVIFVSLINSAVSYGSVCGHCPPLCPKDISAGPSPRVSWAPFYNCINGDGDVPLQIVKTVDVEQCCRSDYGDSATLWGQAHGGSIWYCDYDQYTNVWYTGQDLITCECFKDERVERYHDWSEVEITWSGTVDITQVGIYPLTATIKWKGTEPFNCGVHAVGEEAALTLNINVTEAPGQGCDPITNPAGSNDVPFTASHTQLVPWVGSIVTQTVGTYDETQSWVLRTTSGYGTCNHGLQFAVQAGLGVGLSLLGNIPGLGEAIEGSLSVNAEASFTNTWPCSKNCMRAKVQVYQRKIVREYSGTQTVTSYNTTGYNPPPTTSQATDTATIWPNVLPGGNGNILGNCCYSVNGE